MESRILIIDRALEFGGSIVSTANLIRGIDRERCHIVLMTSADETMVRRKLRELADSVEVVKARKALHYNNIGRYFSVFRRARSRVVRRFGVVLIYFCKLLVNLPYMWAIYRTVKRRGIDTVQMNNGLDDEAAVACRFLGVRQLVYLRGFDGMSYSQRQFFYPRVDLFFAVSDFIRRQALADGLAADRVVVATPPILPDPVPPERMKTLRRQHRLAPGEQAVGIFGRIITWKGQRELLRAAEKVLTQGHSVRFFLVGEVTDNCQDYREELAALIATTGIDDRVVFTGYVEEVYTYYELMDIVVHASTSPEPSGRVILEAMGQGKPVIASPLGGPPEFIVHGRDGYLVDPRDSESLANHIARLLDKPDLARAMGVRARHKAVEYYSAERYGKTMGHYYGGRERELDALYQ